ncbi:MAG: hypothetical protein EHM53_05785, partial [Methanoregulaceae archaeon]
MIHPIGDFTRRILFVLCIVCIVTIAAGFGVPVSAGSPTYVTKWGMSGNANGQLSLPAGVAVSPTSGNVYVADTYNHRIQEFTSTGSFVTEWGSDGSGDGQFHYPSYLAVSPAGNVYVTDQSHNRVQVFTSSGAYVTQWGSY